MNRSVKEIAELVDARVLGDGEMKVSSIASIQSAKSGDLVFAEDEKSLTAALQSAATAVITGEFANLPSSCKPLLIADQPRLAFARAARMLGNDQDLERGTHWTAVVDDSASVGTGVRIEEWVIVKAGVVIGENSRIGAGCFLGEGVKVGRNCILHPNVSIYPGTSMGDRVTVHSGAVLGSDGFGYVRDPQTGHYEKFPQIGRLEIEGDVEIGANSTLDRGALDATRIGRGTKIDNLVHVGHNAQIGENVVIAAQTGISGSAVVEDNVIIGGQVGIADHVRIEAGAILGAQSGIPSKKVIRGQGIVFWGTPARPIKEYLKELAVLARLARKSPSGSSVGFVKRHANPEE
jgi:UDP-3-O-[3-hydroxymyristoyl] glucosamine N-acyltransferase